MEIVGSYFYVQDGTDTMTNAILSSLEEGLEMSGVAIFVYALLLYKQTFKHQSKMSAILVKHKHAIE